MPKKKGYLFVLPWPLDRIGGVNQVVINLAREMQEANELRPLVLIHEWSAIRPITEDVQGLKTIRWRIRPYFKGMGLKRKIAFILWKIRFKRNLQRFCRDHNVIAINLHFPVDQAFSIERVIRKFKNRIQLILSFHGSDVNAVGSEGEWGKRQWKSLLLNPAVRVVVCSDDLGSRLDNAVGRDVESLTVHNGLDIEAFSSMANEPMLSSERVILNVAKFDENKGQRILINAFSEIALKYADVKLVLVGGSGKVLPGLKVLCKEMGIDKRVEFHLDVPHERVADFYQRATIFCLPSRNEAFGIVLLEAGSFALPIVATRVGGVPEIVDEGINGILVNPDSQSELAHSIMLLLDDPVAAEDMGKRLYQHVNSNFSWASAYRKYSAMLPDIDEKYKGSL